MALIKNGEDPSPLSKSEKFEEKTKPKSYSMKLTDPVASFKNV